MAFAPEYVRCVLRENFDDAKALFIDPLLAIHRAHLVMLAERGIVSREDARTLRDGLDAVDPDDIRRAPFDGTCEDLFFHVDRLLVERCGESVAGRLHTARSRNDIDMTMYRMRQRRGLLSVLSAAMASAEFDAADLERRAGEGWITITELADTLVRGHGLSFGAAHGVARRVVEARVKDPSASLSVAVEEATAGLRGGPIRCDEPALQASLSPRRFVEVRATLGGPAPAETGRALGVSQSALDDDRAWLTETGAGLESAAAELNRRSAAL